MIRNGVNKSNMVPKAAGSWPIIGHMYLLTGSQVPHKVLGSMADKFGPIFTIKLGLQQVIVVIVVNNSEMAKECLITKGKVFASRPKAMVIELMGYNYAHVRVSEVNKSITDMHTTWKTNKGSPGMVKIDMKQWFKDLVMNIIARMLFGDQFSHSQQNGDEFKKVIIQFNELLGVLVPSDVIPGLRWLDLGGYEKMMKKTAKKMDAATDTTIVAITWALTLLVNNPIVLEKAQKELKNHVGADRIVDESILKNLVYLQAIIKETMRLYPHAPLSLLRESIEDCTVGGYTVPKGTRLLVNIWKIQHDPHRWTNPFEFQPEKFMISNKVNGQHLRLIPFSSRRRMCPGKHFAIEVLLLIFANIIHVFEFKNPSGDKIDMTESHGLANLKPTPLELLVAPRLLPNLSVYDSTTGTSDCHPLVYMQPMLDAHVDVCSYKSLNIELV
ncbi:cytochrome P450 [Artemisia annua]|uniref:Cytochrome P450 n=1 Tax=Artemisia annua TaxID=35608 RepID=A0A2U1NYC9_ARTAN|nr:cytochrome P450 [Artemisia annua]